VVIRPTNRGKKPNAKKSLKEEINSTIAAREIAGIPKRKENFAASPLSHPDIKALEIVTPDLDTPGKLQMLERNLLKNYLNNYGFLY